MASEALVKKALALTFEVGIDEKGEPIKKRYTYSNINVLATSQNVFDASQAIAALTNGVATDATTIYTHDLMA